MNEYKLEVSLNPHYHDNQLKPYFWCIYQYSKLGNWCNQGFGWSKTIEEATQEGTKYYIDNFYQEENKWDY